jgi:periplasmic mercuric ion binding protein
MKNLILLLSMLIIGAATNSTFAQKADNKVVCFKSNMDCQNCEKTLADHLRFEKGIKDLKVDHASNTIYIEYKIGKNSEDGMAKSIEKKGYLAEQITEEEYKTLLVQSKENNHEHGTEVHIERK